MVYHHYYIWIDGILVCLISEVNLLMSNGWTGIVALQATCSLRKNFSLEVGSYVYFHT